MPSEPMTRCKYCGHSLTEDHICTVGGDGRIHDAALAEDLALARGEGEERLERSLVRVAELEAERAALEGELDDIDSYIPRLYELDEDGEPDEDRPIPLTERAEAAAYRIGELTVERDAAERQALEWKSAAQEARAERDKAMIEVGILLDSLEEKWDSLVRQRDSARAEVARLREALERAIADIGQSHYAHYDPRGTAGANCPACIAQREATYAARAALAEVDRE